MDRGMQMGEGGEPSGATPLRDASRHKCDGCGVETDLITPYCLICQVEGEIKSFLTDSEVGEARKRVRAALEAALAAPEAASAEGSPSHPSPRCAKCELSAWDWMDGKRICHYCRTPFPTSGPSQDSQEVSEAIETLRGFAKRWCDDGQCRNINGYSHDPECRDFYNAIDAVEAVLSQSPKGAAPKVVEDMWCPNCEYLMEAKDAGGESAPSAPKTGLRGAAAPKEPGKGGLEVWVTYDIDYRVNGYSNTPPSPGDPAKWIRMVEAGDVGEAGGDKA